MEDFFATVTGRWPAGREDYCWHVLPGSATLPARLAGQYRELTHQPELAPVNADWMHLTVQHLAPGAEVGGAELGRMIRLVRSRCGGIAPFPVTVGRAEAWDTSLVCPVRPAYLLRFLRQVITEISREVSIGRFSTSEAPYCPHLTLAYALAHVDNEPVRQWIADSEATEETLHVTRLVLVAQQHDRYDITWRVIDEVSLTGAI
jgi:2'-5' RNA ligase